MMMPELVETLFLPNERPILELDELWSYVLKKVNKRWIWMALCWQTRQVVAFVIGDRSTKTCRRVVAKSPEGISARTLFYRFLESISSDNSIRTT